MEEENKPAETEATPETQVTPQPEAAPEPAPEAATASGELSSEEKNWGMLSHLSPLIGVIIPLGSIIAPLVIWLIKKNESSEFVADQALESLNFQITLFIGMIIGAVLTIIVIGIFVIFAVGIGGLILMIIAAVKSAGGEQYRYPICLRLIK